MIALIPRPDAPFRPADAFHVLTNNSRRRMLNYLRSHGTTGVIALADELGLSTLKVYHHLDLLERAGLVRFRKTADETLVTFRPLSWARLKRKWQSGYEAGQGLIRGGHNFG